MRYLTKLLQTTVTMKDDFDVAIGHSTTKATYHNFTDFGLPDLSFQLAGSEMMDLTTVLQSLKNCYTTIGIPLDIIGIHYHQLLEDGVLRIPLKVKIGPYIYCFFFVYNEKCAARFLDAQTWLSQLNQHRCIYLSTQPIDFHLPAQSALTGLQFDHFRLSDKQVSPENFSVWWATPEEPHFPNSKSAANLRKIYHALNGYESYFIGRFFKALEIPEFTGEAVRRVALPEKEKTLTIVGPEEQHIVISFSEVKGIRLHFDRHHSSFTYRSAILEQLSIAIQTYTIRLQLQQLPKDDRMNPKGERMNPKGDA